MRSSPTAVTPPKVLSIGTTIQCEVALRPSSNPAAASSTEPEHTEVVQVEVVSPDQVAAA